MTGLILSLLAAMPVVPLDDPNLVALEAEIARARHLQLPGAPPPYFIALVQHQEDRFVATAELGALLGMSRRRLRTLHCEVRVGDMRQDSSGFLGGMDLVDVGIRQLPLRADALAVRWDAWQGIDAAYKLSVEVLNRKRGKLAEEQQVEPVDDFSPAPAVVMSNEELAQPGPLDLGPANWPERLQRVSAALRPSTSELAIERGTAMLDAYVLRRTLVSTEGSRLALPHRLAAVHLGLEVRAEDGMAVVLRRSFYAATPAQLPDEPQLLTAARELRNEALAMAGARLMEPYDGPVLFEREAAAQLIQLLLLRHVAANRPLRSAFDTAGDGGEESPFVGRLGRRVAAPILDVIDDPGLHTIGGEPLLGGYEYDDEGVRGQRVQLIKGGVLVGWLASRRPSRDTRLSNGHGRSSSVSRWPQAAPSNVIVRVARPLNDLALRRRLQEEARAAQVRMPLIVRRIQGQKRDGGLAVRLTSAVFLEPGGQEQPVRGGELGWVSPRLLRSLVAGGDRLRVHTMLVDEDGDANAAGFPVSIACPPLLLRDVEVVRERGPFPRPRLLPPPAP
ncbi:MAG: metallopeptidase TldD-related protein [Myxococcales bacterium]|nr:metallopeptidase TldD-related protein [Myxococcota bacterium]MDW8281676.1 metallopeptidase TldD-related protein [Myxococcales bacterium]